VLQLSPPKHFRVERLVHSRGVAGRKLTNTIERTFFMTETCADERSSRPGFSRRQLRCLGCIFPELW
jgi:hypothetical protein